MGTFSMLFMMVLRSSPPIFSFVLIFSKLGQNMSQWYWTISVFLPRDAMHSEALVIVNMSVIPVIHAGEQYM